jgi:hypothetical protein
VHSLPLMCLTRGEVMASKRFAVVLPSRYESGQLRAQQIVVSLHLVQ